MGNHLERREPGSGPESGRCRVPERGWPELQRDILVPQHLRALAIGSGNGWGSGSGETTVKAQRGALEKCRTTNRDCQVAVSRCAVASTTAVAQSLRYSSKREQRNLRDRYGSIAFSQQGDGGYQWGFTWDLDSREAARNRAIAGCRSKGGRSCSEIFQFRNTRGALAIGGANGWGAGAGTTTLEAQRGALKQCRTTNRNCQVAVSRCAKASTKVATAGRSLSSAKVGAAAPQRNVASRDETKLTQSGRRRIQQALAASGFNPGGADGVFGPKTRAALRAWQTANGYPATGQLTSEQLRILQSGKRRTRPVDAPTLAEAVAAYKRRDYATALKGYRFHAERGDAAVQTNLGLLYANGQGVARNDAEAVRWYRKAARQGYANAQTNLGVMYDHGRGVRQNIGEALRLYRLAAAQGEPYAQNNLGIMYANGRGVARNDKEAERWYRKAAKQGHADAQASLKRIVNARRETPRLVTPPPPKRNLADIMRAEGVRLDRVAYWLKEGLDPNARDQSGDTPLHYAATDPFPDGPGVVRLLISAGARCDARSNDGDTPLHVAAGTGTTSNSFNHDEAGETVRLLLNCGANPNRRNNDGNTPLHTTFTGTDIPTSSSGAGDFGVIGALLRGGAKPNAKNNDGDTALTLAVQKTDELSKSVGLLLRHGADPDTRNRKGSAVLHLAAQEERPSVVAALLAGGADPDAKDKQGDAAVHIVVKKRRERAQDIEALLAGGADPCVRDRKRNIPIAYPEEGSRANRLLASAGGTDWACGQKSVAEAPTQKPQETADRSKATTATAAKQQPATKARPKSGTPQTRANPYTAVRKALAASLQIDHGDVYAAFDAATAAGAPGIAAYAREAFQAVYGGEAKLDVAIAAAVEVAKTCPPPTNCDELRDAAAAWVEAAKAYIASPKPGNDAYHAAHGAEDIYHAAGLNAQAPAVVRAYESAVKIIGDHGVYYNTHNHDSAQAQTKAAKAAAASSCR